MDADNFFFGSNANHFHESFGFLLRWQYCVVHIHKRRWIHLHFQTFFRRLGSSLFLRQITWCWGFTTNEPPSPSPSPSSGPIVPIVTQYLSHANSSNRGMVKNDSWDVLIVEMGIWNFAEQSVGEFTAGGNGNWSQLHFPIDITQGKDVVDIGLLVFVLSRSKDGNGNKRQGQHLIENGQWHWRWWWYWWVWGDPHTVGI